MEPVALTAAHSIDGVECSATPQSHPDSPADAAVAETGNEGSVVGSAGERPASPPSLHALPADAAPFTSMAQGLQHVKQMAAALAGRAKIASRLEDSSRVADAELASLLHAITHLAHAFPAVPIADIIKMCDPLSHLMKTLFKFAVRPGWGNRRTRVGLPADCATFLSRAGMRRQPFSPHPYCSLLCR